MIAFPTSVSSIRVILLVLFVSSTFYQRVSGDDCYSGTKITNTCNKPLELDVLLPAENFIAILDIEEGKNISETIDSLVITFGQNCAIEFLISKDLNSIHLISWPDKGGNPIVALKPRIEFNTNSFTIVDITKSVSSTKASFDCDVGLERRDGKYHMKLKWDSSRTDPSLYFQFKDDDIQLLKPTPAPETTKNDNSGKFLGLKWWIWVLIVLLIFVIILIVISLIVLSVFLCIRKRRERESKNRKKAESPYNNDTEEVQAATMANQDMRPTSTASKSKSDERKTAISKTSKIEKTQAPTKTSNRKNLSTNFSQMDSKQADLNLVRMNEDSDNKSVQIYGF